MRSRAAVTGEVEEGINDFAVCGVAVGKVEVVDLKWMRLVVRVDGESVRWERLDGSMRAVLYSVRNELDVVCRAREKCVTVYLPRRRLRRYARGTC